MMGPYLAPVLDYGGMIINSIVMCAIATVTVNSEKSWRVMANVGKSSTKETHP